MRLRDPRLWLALAVTALFLWLALRDVDFRLVARAMARADWILLVAGSVPAYLAMLWLRARRWRHLTDPIRPVPFGPLFRALAVGFMANNLFPLRVGEVARAWYLARETGASGSALFGTVVLERVIDGVVFLLLVGVILSVYGGGGDEGGLALSLELPILAVLSAPLGVVVVVRLWPDRMAAWARTGLRPFSPGAAERVADMVGRFAEGLGAISRGGHLFWIAWHSVLIWLVASVVPFWIGLRALGIDLGSPATNLAASYVLLTAVGIAVALPSVPGFFGPYHFACRAALGLYGVEQSLAVAMGTLTHAVFWVTMTGTGLAVLRLRRTPLHELEEHTSVEDLGPQGPAR